MIVRAPDLIPIGFGRKYIFLAGAIDMGSAVNWQADAEAELDTPDTVVLNPRRPDWDASWVQEASNPQFRKQVEWELLALRLADVALFVFLKDSKAPITFLELGLFNVKAVVVVEPGFYRKGNLDIVCEHFALPEFETLTEGIEHVRMELNWRK